MSRKVKLQLKYRQLAHRVKIVPELKISGVWLEEIGFKAGQRVNIIARSQKLIIKPAE
jgi:toxic protein SymE